MTRSNAHSPAARALLALAVALLGLVLVPPGALAADDWTWPVDGEVITQYENGEDPYASGQHRGIDIAGGVGEDVRAATGGTVTFAGGVGSSGLLVSVRTADGRFDTSYLHLESIDVGPGEQVGAGQPLGKLGTSGVRSAEEPHLHFGVREAGERHAYRDPLAFLGPAGAPGTEPPPPPAAPAPVRVRPTPSPSPVRSPVPRPALGPKGAPAPASAVAPNPIVVPPPVPATRPSPRSAPRPRPAVAPRPSGAPARAPAPAPAPGLGPEVAPARVALGQAPEASRAAVPAPESGGLELGWVAALAGFVVAGVLLVRSHLARARERAERRVTSAPALRPRRTAAPASMP